MQPRVRATSGLWLGPAEPGDLPTRGFDPGLEDGIGVPPREQRLLVRLDGLPVLPQLGVGPSHLIGDEGIANDKSRPQNLKVRNRLSRLPQLQEEQTGPPAGGLFRPPERVSDHVSLTCDQERQRLSSSPSLP